jgi:hypothetical protein
MARSTAAKAMPVVLQRWRYACTWSLRRRQRRRDQTAKSRDRGGNGDIPPDQEQLRPVKRRGLSIAAPYPEPLSESQSSPSGLCGFCSYAPIGHGNR